VKRFRQSIRQKVRFGYYAVVIMIIGLSAFTFIELNFLEKKVVSGEAISEFFDTALEIRRFEKNYFLYEQRSDYDENLQYVKRAGELFNANLAGFAAVATTEQVIGLREGLLRYRELMEQYEKLIRRQQKRHTGSDSALKIRLSGDIRKAGKDIITVAEEMSRTERRSLQALLANSRRVLIISITLLILLVIVIGQILARMVVKPLKLMERSMEVIAKAGSRTSRSIQRTARSCPLPGPSTRC